MDDSAFDAEALAAQLVAILFVAGEAAERGAVQRALDIGSPQLNRVVAFLREQGMPGLFIQEHEDTLRIVTSPETAFAVRRFTQSGSATRLSPAALETLAVIAYSQPATRAQVQEARGVNSDGAIETLLVHSLIVEVGRADGPGRPALFQTTPDCLSLLGIASLRDLPPLTGEQPPMGEQPPGAGNELLRLPTNGT